ncbi:type IX secretion system outer membrane channel protein PorV [Mucilaginibacter limnophilus]|uniref:Type IX secretion system outer membrane channel protein PorV n=1 Tax=Mucilaginibacter limnophilus TaxID=1932778 RepID=A0A3S2Y4J2_9SPHI|nr:type IX secretion system outer membrane channel protein PorV [Mucilaginibacter limnophilus]RVU01858.1 type IX secretion system outer membrane channel protein PorV [Mucilaginibacter limnophilus]
MRYLILKAASLALFFPCAAFAQTGLGGSSVSAVPTEVPFLNISPDSRSGAMGDAGVAISPDVNATHWNPSKLAFLEENTAISLSYSPWLRRLVSDVNLAYLSFAKRIDERNTLGASIRYFNLGSINLRGEDNADLGTYTPNEFAIDGSFARKFGENLSLGLTLRYIHSNLSNISFTAGSPQTGRAANAVAADVSMYFKNPTQQFGTDALFAFGANISNIGTKIGYTDNGPKYFLPTNMKVGIANTWYLDATSQLTFAFDLNKLLIPTTKINDDGSLNYGEDISVPSGIFRSFTDAPGGFSEELREVTVSPGFEYWYNQQFALRTGYFFESSQKGGRKYLSLGAGFKYQDFRFDFSYLAASQQNSPFANTLRFTLSADLGSKKQQ